MTLGKHDPRAALAGRVAVVTGASRGIGEATTLELARQGATIVLIARSTSDRPDRSLPGTLDETVEAVRALGGEALAIPADISIDDDIERIRATTIEHFGGCDVLVNNAAIAAIGPFRDLTPQKWDKVFAVNVRAPMMLAQAFLPGMVEKGWGRIINISSNAGRQDFDPGALAREQFGQGEPGDRRVAYGSSKAALNRLTTGLAREVAGTGVTVNALEVLAISPVFRIVRPDADFSAFELPEAPAQLVAWLASQPDDFTGKLLVQNDLLPHLRAEGTIRPKANA